MDRFWVVIISDLLVLFGCPSVAHIAQAVKTADRHILAHVGPFVVDRTGAIVSQCVALALEADESLRRNGLDDGVAV